MIGIFGGTFDPVHLGHRQAVDQLCAALPMERVHWVLSARPPHKDQVSATIKQRFAMLKLALADEPRYLADDTEIVRTQKSYTIDTVNAFKAKYPDKNLSVLIGGDSLQNLHTWRQYDALMESVNWVVMHRPGYPLEVPRELTSRLVESPAELLKHENGKLWVFSESNIDVSSTRLRQALSETKERSSASVSEQLVQKYVAAEVLDYIRTHELYKKPVVDTQAKEHAQAKEHKKSMGSKLNKTILDNTILDNTMNADQVKDQVIDALEDIKGQDIKVLDIADISNFADYMIVASGTSDTHVKALARSASDKLRKQGVKPLNEDGSDVGEWVLVDFGDVVLHVMRPEVRAYYDLEKLWDEDVRKLVEQHREERDD